MNNNIINDIIVELAVLIEPLERLDSPQRVADFVRHLGWEIPEEIELTVDLGTLITSITNGMIPAIVAVNNAASDEEIATAVADLGLEIVSVVKEIKNVAPDIIDAIEQIPGYISDPNLDDHVILFERLLSHLIQQYLRVKHPRTFSILWFMGILDYGETTQGSHFDVVHWERIPNWIGQPSVIFDSVYGWRSRFDFEELLGRISVIIEAFALPGGLYPVDPDIHSYLGDARYSRELRIPLVMSSSLPDYHSEFGINISPSGNGIAIFPTLIGSIDIEAEIADSIILKVKGNADLDEGFALTITPPDQIRIDTSLFTENPIQSLDARVEASLRKVTQDGALTLLFGAPGTSRFGFKELGTNLLIAYTDNQGEVGIELEIKNLSLLITTSVMSS